MRLAFYSLSKEYCLSTLAAIFYRASICTWDPHEQEHGFPNQTELQMDYLQAILQDQAPCPCRHTQRQAFPFLSLRIACTFSLQLLQHQTEETPKI